MKAFSREFALSDESTVADFGGSAHNWSLIAEAPRVTLINIDAGAFRKDLPRNLVEVVGSVLETGLPDGSFDIVYSNSVIEHVGGEDEQKRFADEARRIGKGIWIQTPAFECPVEPHYLGVFLHWFPLAIRVWLARWFTIWGWVNRPSRSDAVEFANDINLLRKSDMLRLFPDCRIVTERTFLIPRCYIAIRGFDDAASQSIKPN